jgi:hypothetical protein
MPRIKIKATDRAIEGVICVNVSDATFSGSHNSRWNSWAEADAFIAGVNYGLHVSAQCAPRATEEIQINGGCKPSPLPSNK